MTPPTCLSGAFEAMVFPFRSLHGLVGFLLSVLTLPLQAQTNFTWVGGGGNWTAPANWNPSGVPGEQDTATIASGSAAVNAVVTVARLHLNGGNLSSAGSQALTVLQSGTWTGGTVSGVRLVVGSGCTFSLAGASTKTLGSQGVVTNEGKVIWSGGQFNLDNNQAFHNRPGALFEVQTDSPLVQTVGGTSTFRNEGTYLKSAGAGTNTIGIGSFVNRGTVQASSGTIRFAPSMLDSTAPGNAYRAAEGATVQLAPVGGGSVFTDTIFSGVGLKVLNVGAGAVNVTGSVAATNLVFGGGNWQGQATLVGSLNWTGGTVYNAQLTIAPGSHLLLSGDGTKQVQGGGGTGAITNLGMVTWTGGAFRLDNTARFLNAAGALFDVQTDSLLTQNGGGTSVFRNEGTYQKSAGAGTNTITLGSFVNGGMVRVASGTIRFAPAGLEATAPGNTFHAEDGAALQLGPVGGATAFTGSIFGGPGLKILNLGTGSANVNAGLAATNLVFAGGNWQGQATLAGSLNWTGGVLNNAQLTISPGSSLVLRGAGAKMLTGGGTGVITNLGTVTWEGGAFNLENSARFLNAAGAVFDVQTDALLAQNGGGTSVFRNEGTYQKSAGAGTNTITLASFVQSGTLAIGMGVVRVVGDYTQGAAGTLRTTVAGQGASAELGRLQVSGRATLAGTLAIAAPGGLDLALGETLPFLAAGSRTGFFATASGGALGNDRYLTPTYGNNRVDLRVAGPGGHLTVPARVGGQFQFQIVGVAGQSYRVEASTNLTDWVPLANVPVPGSGAAVFETGDIPIHPHRFYRTVFLP